MQYATSFIAKRYLVCFRVPKSVQGDAVSALHEFVRILQLRARPLARSDQFRWPDAPIVIGIDQVERPGVELHAPRRASESNPELLVEIADMRNVGSVADQNLIDAAGAEEFEIMCLVHALGRCSTVVAGGETSGRRCHFVCCVGVTQNYAVVAAGELRSSA